MKKIIAAMSLAVLLAGCGGAGDGSATTDTTTMPVDTSINKTETHNTNRADGTIIDSSAMGYDSSTHRY